MDSRDGMVIVYTGSGKGKTTAALGIALRAAGYKMHTAMIQFIKGAMYSGELESARRLNPYFRLFPMGRGFVASGNGDVSLEDHSRAAYNALGAAREMMLSGDYQIIICDEINNAVKLQLLTINDITDLVMERPKHVHLVLTGRDADDRVVELADLVTEMREIKHPFNSGIKAQRGVDF